MVPLLAAALVLAPARSDWTGAVRDAAGKPVGGVTVLVETAGPKVGTSPFCPSCYADCGKRALTDPAGRFRVPSLDASLRFRVVLFRDGYLTKFVRADPLKPADRLVLAPRPTLPDAAKGLISGQVVDDAGRPVPYALLDAQALERGGVTAFGGFPGESVAIADAQGRFRFFGVPAGKRYLFKVTGRGYAPRMASLAVGAKGAVVHVDEGSELTGTVRDAEGKPLANVGVVAVSDEHNSESFLGPYEIGTDARGRFLIPNVAGGERFTVCAKMESLAPKSLAAPRFELAVPKRGTAPTSADLVAVPGAALQGRVALPDGKAVPPHTKVMLGRRDRAEGSTWDIQFTEVAPDGTFAFRGLPRGERVDLSVYVRGYEDYSTSPHPEYDRMRNTLVVPEAGDPPDATLRLMRSRRR